MTHAKIVDGKLVFANKKERFNSEFKEYVRVTRPPDKKWYKHILEHEETDTQIIQVWSYMKISQPTMERLIDIEIGNVYNKNTEIALSNRGIKNPNDEQYIEYRSIIKKCKKLAGIQMAEYKNT